MMTTANVLFVALSIICVKGHSIAGRKENGSNSDLIAKVDTLTDLHKEGSAHVHDNTGNRDGGTNVHVHINMESEGDDEDGDDNDNDKTDKDNHHQHHDHHDPHDHSAHHHDSHDHNVDHHDTHDHNAHHHDTHDHNVDHQDTHDHNVDHHDHHNHDHHDHDDKEGHDEHDNHDHKDRHDHDSDAHHEHHDIGHHGHHDQHGDDKDHHHNDQEEDHNCHYQHYHQHNHQHHHDNHHHHHDKQDDHHNHGDHDNHHDHHHHDDKDHFHHHGVEDHHNHHDHDNHHDDDHQHGETNSVKKSGCGCMKKKMKMTEEQSQSTGYHYARCDVTMDPGMNESPHLVKGSIFFRQQMSGPLEMIIDLNGFFVPLKAEQDHSLHMHGFHVHQYGDFSDGCQSFGGHFNPDNAHHGNHNGTQGHAGDWGNISCNELGQVHTNRNDSHTSLTGDHSIVGRGIVIHADADDHGQGGDESSLKTGNAGRRLACCPVVWSADLAWDLLMRHEH